MATTWCHDPCPLAGIEYVRCALELGHRPPHDAWTVVIGEHMTRQVRVEWWDGGIPLRSRRPHHDRATHLRAIGGTSH